MSAMQRPTENTGEVTRLCLRATPWQAEGGGNQDIRLSVFGNFLCAGEHFEFFGFETFEIYELVLA